MIIIKVRKLEVSPYPHVRILLSSMVHWYWTSNTSTLSIVRSVAGLSDLNIQRCVARAVPI